MDFQSVSYSFGLQRCGPAYFARYIPLEPNETGIVLGRADDSICLNSLYVSRHHLKIFCKNGKWIAVDMKSFNHTFIYQNETVFKLEEFVEYEIFPGAIIGLGINPLCWQSQQMFVEDQDFFVYHFMLRDDEDSAVNRLCDAFKLQIDV